MSQCDNVHVVAGGDIAWRYFDMEAYDNTFKIYGPGLNFKDVYESVCKIVKMDDVRDICKVDSNTFNITVTSDDAYHLLNNCGSIIVRDRSFKVVNISNQVAEFKIHWLPTYIKDSFIEDYFSRYGKVLNVTRENMVYSANDTKSSGIRRVMIETDEVQKRSLPYLVKFNGGYTCLLTMAGRPPFCLKCRAIGHVRRDCKGSTARRSYADAARDSISKEPRDISITKETTERSDDMRDVNGVDPDIGEDGDQQMDELESQSLLCGQQVKRGHEETSSTQDDNSFGVTLDPVTGELFESPSDEQSWATVKSGKKVKASDAT